MELFLDANAHLPMCSEAKIALEEFNLTLAAHGHPSSPSKSGQAAAAVLEQARTDISLSLSSNDYQVQANQIIFTHSCTEAAQWGIELMFKSGLYPACSPIEHPAVKQAYLFYCKKFNKTPIFLNVNGNGDVDLNTSQEAIICHSVHNETGVFQDLFNISDKFVFADMCQQIGKFEMSFKNIDIAVFGSHKFGGTGNFGFMYLKDTSLWQPFATGSRYFYDRSGTHDVGAAVACAAALKASLEKMRARDIREQMDFQKILENYLETQDIEVVGQQAYCRSPFTTFCYVPGKALEIMFALGEKDIHVGLGSACGGISYDSPTIKALGRSGGAHDYLRISQSGEYGEAEANFLIDNLKDLL